VDDIKKNAAARLNSVLLKGVIIHVLEIGEKSVAVKGDFCE
jgi:hypothetical protein